MCPRAARAPALRLLALGALLWPAAGAWELTILHTNDVHSRLEQTSADSSKCVNASLCVGGVARLSTKVRQIRRAEPHVLLLDAGDQYQGTIWFTVYKGAEVAHFMNALGYDAMALGNHEFDNGVEGLIDPLLKEAKFPILSANIKAKGPLASQISGLYSPYKILPVGNEVVGIVGYTSKETPFLSNPGTNLVFEDEIAALQPEVDKLKTLNVNKIIALGHSGFEMDKLIAQKVKGVDVVVGGHTNTFLYTGNPPSKEVPEGQYPFTAVLLTAVAQLRSRVWELPHAMDTAKKGPSNPHVHFFLSQTILSCFSPSSCPGFRQWWHLSELLLDTGNEPEIPLVSEVKAAHTGPTLFRKLMRDAQCPGKATVCVKRHLRPNRSY